MIQHFDDFKRDVFKKDITNIILDIISKFNCSYFNAKKIRYNLYFKYGIDIRGRPSSDINICNGNDQHFKIFLTSRIGHVTRKLFKQGYIEKFNRNTWKKIKDINFNDSTLYLHE